MFKAFLFFLMISISVCGEELTLVKDGKANSAIVVAKDANRSARLGAAELQYHIEKITGVKLPIVNDIAQVTGVRVLVGESPFTQKHNLYNKDLKNQEYLIKFLPDTIIMMGKDPVDTGEFDYMRLQAYIPKDLGATPYAVYDFLEKFWDVRWYLPKEIGMVYSKSQTFSVKPKDIRRTPSMNHRVMYAWWMIPASLTDEVGPSLDRRDAILFSYRQRRLGANTFVCNHAFYGYYSAFLKDHPDWFAKGYAEKLPGDFFETINKTSGMEKTITIQKYYPNMCYTNRGFINHVADSARSFFDTGKFLAGGGIGEGDFVGMGPMDSHGKDKVCKCDECAKWLHETPPCREWQKQPFFWDDLYSDYIFHFTNEVAKELAKTHPGKFVSQLAYHQNYYPPTKEKLSPNVAVQFCIHELLRVVPNYEAGVKNLLDKWDEESKDRPKYLWLYFHRPGRANPFFPGFAAGRVIKDMEDYHRRGYRGIFMEPSYMSEGKFNNYAPVVNMLEDYLVWKLAYDANADGNKIVDEFFARYYGNAGAAMRELYDYIEGIYCDPKNYAPLSQDYIGYQTPGVAWGVLGTTERVERIGLLMKKAVAAAKTPEEKERVALFETSIWKRMKAASDRYRDADKAAIPADLSKYHTSAMRLGIAGEPVNGNPAQVDWSQVTPSNCLDIWTNVDGKLKTSRLKAKLANDGKYLYICLEDKMNTEKLVSNPDGDVWGEDGWEIFFRRNLGGGIYHQLGLNVNGRFIARSSDGKTWDSGAKVISTVKKPDGWTVVLSLSLAELLPGGVKGGDKIFMNIIRSRCGVIKNSRFWVPTYDGHHSATRLGIVTIDAERTKGE